MIFSRFGDNTDIIAGDHNFCDISFSFNNTGLIVDSNRSASIDIIYDCFSIPNLSQYNCSRNLYGNIFDLIFPNLNLISVESFLSPLVTMNKPHPPISTICESYKINNLSTPTQVYRNFSKTYFDNISIALNKMNWCNLFFCNNVDKTVVNFYTVVN